MFLGSTLVLRRKFKPPLVLEDIEKHKVTAMVVVPVMLSRILDALEKMDKKPDLSSLRSSSSPARSWAPSWPAGRSKTSAR